MRLGIISATGGDTTWVKWDNTRYPYLATVKWEENAPLTILVQNREQTEGLLLAVDSETGAATELLKETDPAWVNIDPTMPHWLADGKSFLWSTERGGAWRLELRNRDGSLAATLTKPTHGYRKLVGVNDKLGMAYFIGGDNPTMSRLFDVGLKSDDPRPLPFPLKAGIHIGNFLKEWQYLRRYHRSTRWTNAVPSISHEWQRRTRRSECGRTAIAERKP